MLARAHRHLFHVTPNAFVRVVVIFDDFLRFLSRDADALRQSPRLDCISDGEVDYLRKPTRFSQFFIGLRAKNESRRARVNVFAFLKRFEHHRILRDVGQQTQLELRVVGRNDLVSLLCHERAPNTPSHFTANRNVLKIRIARRKTSGGGNRLVELAMNASVSRDLLRQRVRVDTLQFIELAILDDQTRQLKLLGQLFEHGFARGNATGGSFPAEVDIQISQHFADLLRRTDIEFASGKLIDLDGELMQFLTDVVRKISRALSDRLSARRAPFDRAAARVEVQLPSRSFRVSYREFALCSTEAVRAVRSAAVTVCHAVSGQLAAGALPFSTSERFACKIRELILAAIWIEQVRGEKRIVFDAFERDVEAIEQSNRAFHIVNRFFNQSI